MFIGLDHEPSLRPLLVLSGSSAVSVSACDHFTPLIFVQGTGKWYELQDLQVTDILPQMITLSEAYIQVGVGQIGNRIDVEFCSQAMVLREYEGPDYVVPKISQVFRKEKCGSLSIDK